MGLCYNFYKLKATAPQRQQFRPTFMKTRIARHVAIYLFIALTGYGIGACRQNVMLNPSEDDLIVLNGCVVSAATIWRRSKPNTTWRKTFGRKFFWSVMPTIPPVTRIAFGNGRHDLRIRPQRRWVPYSGLHPERKVDRDYFGQELSRHLKENLSVSHADFVEPSTKVQRF